MVESAHGVSSTICRFGPRFPQHVVVDEGLAGAGECWPPNRMMADLQWMQRASTNPLHSGVTEAGDGDYGASRRHRRIATLLTSHEGLGDNIRVALN